MKKDWKISTPEEQKVMWINVKFCRIILIYCAVLTYGTVITYAFHTTIILNSYLKKVKYFDNSSMDKPLFLNSKFFFEIQKSPIFEIIWICQLFAAFISAAAFTAFDGFFIFSILHLCGQLSNLRFQIKNLAEKNRSHSFLYLLNKIVNRHIHLQK